MWEVNLLLFVIFVDIVMVCKLATANVTRERRTE